MFKLLSFQPVSLYKNGGASRVLRRLYEGKEDRVLSIGISENTEVVLQGAITENIIKARPLQRPWMRWKLRDLAIWLRQKVWLYFTTRQIQSIVAAKRYDVIHLVCHGPYTMSVYADALLKGKQLWVSFHDHFIPAGISFAHTEQLWANANRRLVISKEIGLEYQRLFGYREFEIVTDGVMPDEVFAPGVINHLATVVIYFSGLLHNEYQPLFRVLADALDRLVSTGVNYQLVMRGTQRQTFLEGRSFTIEYRNDFITDAAVKEEMDTAAILYLPIKFNDPDFYLYSMSTKMVGYLGAPGSILYHGPADSAACRMLADAGAAVCCTTLTVEDMVLALNDLVHKETQVSANAGQLAISKFNMVAIRKQFWQE